MSKETKLFNENGMITAALFYENKNQTIIKRLSSVTRYYLENMNVPTYKNNQRYMLKDYFYFGNEVINDDMDNNGLKININGDVWYDSQAFFKFIDRQEDAIKPVLWRVSSDVTAMTAKTFMARYEAYGLHVMFNFKRLLAEGINGYKQRVLKKLEDTTEFEEVQFLESMLNVANGSEVFISRYLEYLESLENQIENKKYLNNLINAYKNVPMNPASSFFEALVSIQTIMFFSQQLEIGSVDRYLYPYLINDLNNNVLTIDEAYEILDDFFKFIDDYLGSPYAVHLTIGGTKEDGTMNYNELTEMVIKLCKVHRQPNISLKVRKDMPEKIWNLVLDNIKSGSAQPALVNDEQFINSFMTLNNVPYKDAVNYTFSGCSEAQIEGMTNVDSTYVAFNTLDVLESTINNHLLECNNYESFYNKFINELKFSIKEMTEHVNIRHHHDSLYHPHPVATFFMDDCIDNMKAFGSGGTRYNFDNTNLYGTSNVINALYTIKKVFNSELHNVTPSLLIDALKDNYQNYSDVYQQIKKLPKFGNFDTELDDIAQSFMLTLFTEVNKYRTYRGNGYFTPSVIGWVEFGPLGRLLGATPDGRLDGETIADSIGPMQGTDTDGPTSMLSSVGQLPQHLANGTCILNLRLDEKAFSTYEGDNKVKALLETYFALGGNQLQINVVNTEILKKAMENPEAYKNIIVRIGGFSDYFVKQSKEIKEDIISRTIHE